LDSTAPSAIVAAPESAGERRQSGHGVGSRGLAAQPRGAL
jgi:hypothetical protein